MKPCYIFDVDGTIADNSHRTPHLQKKPKDWNSYHEGVADDIPHKHIADLASKLGEDTLLVFCTGRHEGQRLVTEDWLYKLGLLNFVIYMRTDNDFRADHIIKEELLLRIRQDGLTPIMAFDDRNSVVEMWRRNGVPCAQVAEGNF